MHASFFKPVLLLVVLKQRDAMLSVTPQSLIASQTDVAMFSPVPDAILDTHISWSTPSPDITKVPVPIMAHLTLFSF